MFENEGAPEGTETEILDSTTGTEPTEQPAPITDLDSLEKFKFRGKEYTPKDFFNDVDVGGLRMSDYTKKMQEISKDREYHDNLKYDLSNVKAGKATADQFKSVYPEKFHHLLDYLTQAQPSPSNPTPGNKPAPGGLDPQFMSEFQEMKRDMHERRVSAIDAEIDATFRTLSAKYPMADEESVIARGQALLDQGQKLTQTVWDTLFKSVHDRYQKLADQHYSQKVNQQKNANSKSKDVASGGGTPGSAPKVPRTIKEATQFALQEMENS